MATLRTNEMYRKYEEYKKAGNLSNGCNLCSTDKIMNEFKFWKVIDALFPWDRIAETQHLIIPKRHVKYDELNEEEKEEFDYLKNSFIDPKYDIIAEATTKMKSIPEHFHLHLIVVKR